MTNAESGDSNLYADDYLMNTDILSLDDDSLLHTFKFLPLQDKLSFARAHYRFATIFQMFAKVNARKVIDHRLPFDHQFDKLTPVDIRYFFKFAGEFIETLTLPPDFERRNCASGFSLIKLYCPNLKSLGINGYHRQTVFHFDRLRELLSNKEKLKTLRLKGVAIKDVYINLMIETQLPQLEHLSIVDCSTLTGHSLKKLKNLRKLRLENVEKLTSSALSDALLAMPNLRAFSYHASYHSDWDRTGFVEVLNSLGTSNEKLEILELTLPQISDVDVSQLPKLRHFSYGIRGNSWQAVDFAKLLPCKKDELNSLKIESDYNIEFNFQHCQLISQFTNLQKLYLPFQDYGKPEFIVDDIALRHLCALKNLVEFKAVGLNLFTNSGLLDMVRSCPLLKWVNVQYNKLIDNEFPKKLVPIIKENKRTNGRITFLVWDTKMTRKGLPEEYSSKELRHSVKFIFKAKFYLESYDNCYDDFEHDSGLEIKPFCGLW